MTSTTETGHAKNVANFEKLVADATALGAAYNPSKENLKLATLNTLLTAANAAINAINTAESAYKIAVGERDAAFAPFSKLVTRVSNALKASGSTTQVDENAKTLVRKLQGRRAKPKKTEEQKKLAAAEGKEIVEISSSQMSFDSRLENFDKLIKLLTSVPAYAPNEEELKVSSLTNHYNELKAKNTAVTAAEIPLTNNRISRNGLFYQADTGLVDTSLGVKTYIKSVYGATSPQYKAISKLKFTNHN